MTLSRRNFVTALGALVASAPVAPVRSQPTIDVRRQGASGSGKSSDLEALQRAVNLAAARSGGATIYFPPGEYFLGETRGAYLLVASRLRHVRFVGERATISCRSLYGQSSMLALAGCNNVKLEGLAFQDYGLNRDINWLGAAAIRLVNEGSLGCEQIAVTDCRFDSVLSAIVCRMFDRAAKTHGVVLSNLTVSRSYYGFSWQESGDDVVGRRLRCEDVKRSYFPYGISNHDIELDTSDNKTGFTDVLIKCYQNNTSRVHVKVKCRGKRGGDAIVALDHQHEKGSGAMRDIRIDLDADDLDCRLDTAFMFRSFDPGGRVERRTGNRWDEIFIDGDIRLCDRTQLITIASEAKVPGRLLIGPRLSTHPRLPSSFMGFLVSR